LAYKFLVALWPKVFVEKADYTHKFRISPVLKSIFYKVNDISSDSAFAKKHESIHFAFQKKREWIYFQWAVSLRSQWAVSHLYALAMRQLQDLVSLVLLPLLKGMRHPFFLDLRTYEKCIFFAPYKFPKGTDFQTRWESKCALQLINVVGKIWLISV
jgi:hypothetical protein